MIEHKTKAAMPGRQCNQTKINQGQITRLAAGGQSLSDTGIPVSMNSTTVQICIVLLDNHFPPLPGSAPGILRDFNTEVQIISVRLTYEHRNSLKLFQTVNLQSAQNSLKLLSQLNYREMRELANTLIIPKNTNGAVRLPQIEVLEEINNLVPESHLVHGSSTIGGWRSEAFLYHEENHNIAVLHRNPDLAYERVVPQSHEVNQLSLSKSDSLPTIRGLVNYKIFVVQRLCGTQRPAQHNPEIIGAVHCFTGSKARIRALGDKGKILPLDTKAGIPALAYSDSLVMFQIFGMARLYIWFLIFFSRFLNSFLSSSSSAFNALYFSEIPFSFIAEIANCSSFVSLRSGGNIESGLPVISAVVCLQSTVAGQSHVIPICPAISNTTTSYRSVLLLLSAENLYSIVFLRSGACSLIAFVQPFGSIPCLRNSALANSFSQLPRLTPSLVAAAFSCSRSSGAIRIWKVGDQPSPFCDLSRLIVDTYVRNLIVWFSLRTYVITMDVIKTTPRTVGAVPRRLTKPLTGVTVMAGSQHTQTHPKFTWRFLALNRHDKKAKPRRLSVEAATEREARRILAPHFILSLAARLPVREVSHA